MNLDENYIITNSINCNKDTVLLKFMTTDEKLICAYEYPSETNSNQVIEDFLKKNNENSLKYFLDFDENFSIHNLSFYCKQEGKLKKLELSNIKSLKIDSLEDTVEYLGLNYFNSSSTSSMTNVNFNLFKIYVKYESKYKNIAENFDNYIIDTTYLIGKPKLNRREYYRYNKESKKIKLIPLNQEDIDKTKVNYFSVLDIYCNANNNLYIYEGIADNDIEFSRFFCINLIEKYKIELISSKFPKRILHSMIFIPKSYIFIIGGKNAKEVLIYEIKEGNSEYEKYPNLLPRELLEPSLISVDNKYIYILENSTIFLNIYRVNILSVSPFEKIEIKENNINMNQKFFGVVKKRNSILFLGGQKLNMNFDKKEYNGNNENNYCFEYHFNDNTVTQSKKKFSTINFIEKTFIPIEQDVYMQLAEYKNDENKAAIKIIQINRKEQDMISNNGIN